MNKGYITDQDEVSTVVTATTSNGKTATATITIVYNSKIEIKDDGTTYSIEVGKDAAAYTVSRKDNTPRVVDAEELATDLATVAERLGNWNGSVATLYEKIDAHWGESEDVILDLVNGYFVTISNTTVSEIKDQAEVTFADGIYTIVRKDNTVTVAREIAKDGSESFTITGIKKNGTKKTIEIENIASSLKNGVYTVSADVTLNGKDHKNVVVEATLDKGVITTAKMTTDNNTLVASYENTESAYKAVLNKSYYMNLREKLGISTDIIDEISIVANYK